MKTILKKSAVLSILSVLLITLIIPVFAHPGSLDWEGGHYDRNTGEYPYHHGYSAHQHENGECPYDFKDNIDDDYTPKSNSLSNRKNNKSFLLALIKFLITISILILIITFFLAVYLDFKCHKLTAIRIFLFIFIIVLSLIHVYVLR